MKTYSLAAKIGLIGILTIPLRLYFKSEEIKEPQHNVNHGSVDLNAPTAVKMFNSIEFYSEKYDIPLKYALGVAYVETRYQGPFHWKYNPVQKSSAGALGPMQIMPSTANSVWKRQVPREELASNIDLNVETSMRVLRRLYDKYENWKLVFGCYNTGRPCINGYAEKVYNFNP
jgi:soluble lytic murein transglycosylase-like protein